ncbi:MAG: nucleotidyltransferase domain-containing protein [Oscillospiraceae bacterium]|nr:nucleotidyltransferase domain-containing protein [Oscillospiraceae bacterium]
MAINDEILKIKDAIVGSVPIEKLYLFGSYARGTQNDDSDYDFYMVISNTGMRPLEAMEKAVSSVCGLRRKPMDVLAGTVETFERRSKGISTIEREVANEGVLLYEKP